MDLFWLHKLIINILKYVFLSLCLLLWLIKNVRLSINNVRESVITYRGRQRKQYALSRTSDELKGSAWLVENAKGSIMTYQEHPRKHYDLTRNREAYDLSRTSKKPIWLVNNVKELIWLVKNIKGNIIIYKHIKGSIWFILTYREHPRRHDLSKTSMEVLWLIENVKGSILTYWERQRKHNALLRTSKELFWNIENT